MTDPQLVTEANLLARKLWHTRYTEALNLFLAATMLETAVMYGPNHPAVDVKAARDEVVRLLEEAAA